MKRINTQVRYEYKVHGFCADEGERMDSILTELGQQGWRIIHVYSPGATATLWKVVMERVERLVPESGELFDTPLKNADDVIAVGKWHIGRRSLEELLDFCSRDGVFDRFQEGKFSFASRPAPLPVPVSVPDVFRGPFDECKMTSDCACPKCLGANLEAKEQSGGRDPLNQVTRGATHHTIPLVLDNKHSPFLAPAGYVVSDIPEGLWLQVNGLRVLVGYEIKGGEMLEVKGFNAAGATHVTFKPVKKALTVFDKQTAMLMTDFIEFAVKDGCFTRFTGGGAAAGFKEDANAIDKAVDITTKFLRDVING